MAATYRQWREHYGYQDNRQAREDYARYCQQLELLAPAKPETRGRKPKLKSGAMSAAERKAAERERRKARGEVQMWLTPEEVAAVERMRESE